MVKSFCLTWGSNRSSSDYELFTLPQTRALTITSVNNFTKFSRFCKKETLLPTVVVENVVADAVFVAGIAVGVDVFDVEATKDFEIVQTANVATEFSVRKRYLLKMREPWSSG